MAALLGKAEEFDSAKEEWSQYVERLGYFFVANGITAADKKRAVLLAVVGPATYTVLRNLISPTKPGEVSYSDIVKTLTDHFSPAPSEIVQRFKFNCRARKPGESVATYVAELRAIAEFCNFGGTLEDMLRDRLVCGINDSAIQRRLLAEPKLTFKKALDLSRGLETAARNVEELKTAPPKFPYPCNQNVHVLYLNGECLKPRLLNMHFGNLIMKSCKQHKLSYITL